MKKLKFKYKKNQLVKFNSRGILLGFGLLSEPDLDYGIPCWEVRMLYFYKNPLDLRAGHFLCMPERELKPYKPKLETMEPKEFSEYLRVMTEYGL